ncbi:hypothetical protein chiPu_0018236 [Chiloscyllium punctatum]|uniref:E3 ubiquitin protein ligase n=1 Tax=Chiloscyllium punctatum TaxID=137246 RepID=A0A401RLU0_CHIPU|nr:hypothetical protein [Chiloscyllium punctatum]
MKERETPGAGSKRAAADPPPGPPEKSANLEESAGSSGAKVETIKLGSDSSTEELDIRTLQSKNRKLAEVIDQRQTIEDELREQIEKLVKRQATDDATLLILNRYWCQFDENVRIILQRWDLEQEQESRDVLSEKKMLVVSDPEPDSDSNQERDRREEREKACREGQSESALPFLAMLASSTSEEMELQLQDRVAYSRQAVSSTADVFEKLRLRIDQLAEWVTSKGEQLGGGGVRSRGSSGSQPQAGGTEQVKEEAPDIKQEPEDSSSKREKEEAEAAKQRRQQQQQQEEEKEKEKEKEREREKREKERERAREKGREKDTEKDRDKDKADKERDRSKPEDTKKKEAEMVKQLRGELKRAQESQKEMKLLLDMYRSSPKEQRDKVQLMASEKRAKAELENLRLRLKELEEKERHEGKKMADVEALRRMKLVDEQMEHMLKKVAMAKQEEEALLSEMDVTGQAFEDMQEQNIRLMQQLREKDDANFKLMSERIKSNQIHKLLKEEKEELGDQLLTLKTQVSEHCGGL